MSDTETKQNEKFGTIICVIFLKYKKINFKINVLITVTYKPVDGINKSWLKNSDNRITRLQ